MLKNTKIQINSSWVEVMGEANSLMQEIVLPFYDLLNGGIYHVRAHNESAEADVEDISRESS